LSYQWRKDGYNIGGATATSYSIPFAMPYDSANYTVLVTNAYGSVTSAIAQLIVLGPPNDACTNATIISSVPYTNMQSTLGATSTGDPLPTCGSGFGSGVWYKYTPPLNGKIDVDTIGSDFDTILAVYSGTCGSLVQVSCDDDGGGGVTSKTSANVSAGVPAYILAGGYGGAVGNLVLHLTFSPGGTAPVIFTQPASQSKAIGDTATFSVSLAGSLPLYYQWRKGGVAIAGATSSIYTVAPVAPASAGSYNVLVTNAFGSALSSNALLTVVAGPTLAFLADFESGNNGFTYVADPDATSNLWHRTTHRYVSTNHSQYYGLEGIWTYDTGSRNAGNLQSAPISLVGAGAPASLSFNYLLQTETLTNYDQASVLISSDGGTNWATLASRASANPLLSSTNGTVFTNWIGDISGYAGRTVLLRFNFDTIDGALNDFEGWYVDDVAITAASFQPAFRLRPNVLPNRGFELWVARQDAVALTLSDAARMHVYVCTNLTLPIWQEITNTMTVTNGLIHVDGLSCSNAVQQYFRAMQTP
jgi:hypothetical protein